MKICWEGICWDVSSDKDFLTPLDILEQTGQAGRAAFIEILAINYTDELKTEVFSIAGEPIET